MPCDERQDSKVLLELGDLAMDLNRFQKRSRRQPSYRFRFLERTGGEA